MKKALLALLLAIVMITNFSMALAVMAHDAEDENISSRLVCPICYGTQVDYFCSTLEYYEVVEIQRCSIHPQCIVTVYKDAYITACHDCGHQYSVNYNHLHYAHSHP